MTDGLVPVRDCQTAEEVFQNARIVAARRRMSAALARPRTVPIAEISLPDPVPVQIAPPAPVIDPMEERIFAAEVALDRLRRGPTCAFITAIACDAFDQPVDRAFSRSRKRIYTFTRQRVFWLAYRTTGRSLPDIGRRMGGYDHTTVLHAVNKIDAMMQADPAMAAEMNALKASIELQWQARLARAVQ